MNIRISPIVSLILKQKNLNYLLYWLRLKAGWLQEGNTLAWVYVGVGSKARKAQADKLGVSRNTLDTFITELVNIGLLRPVKSNPGYYHRVSMVKASRHLLKSHGTALFNLKGGSLRFFRIKVEAIQSREKLESELLLIALNQTFKAQQFRENQNRTSAKRKKVIDPPDTFQGLYQKGRLKGRTISLERLEELSGLSRYSTRRALQTLVNEGRVFKFRRQIKSGEGYTTESSVRELAAKLGWNGGKFYRCGPDKWGGNFTCVFELYDTPISYGHIPKALAGFGLERLSSLLDYDRRRNPDRLYCNASQSRFYGSYTHPLSINEIHELYPDYFEDSIVLDPQSLCIKRSPQTESTDETHSKVLYDEMYEAVSNYLELKRPSVSRECVDPTGK